MEKAPFKELEYKITVVLIDGFRSADLEGFSFYFFWGGGGGVDLVSILHNFIWNQNHLLLFLLYMIVEMFFILHILFLCFQFFGLM